MIAALGEIMFARAPSSDAVGMDVEAEADQPHIPVMLAEVLAAVEPKPGEHVVDCTFGAGGYSRAFLEAGLKVTAFDRDPDAIEDGKALVDAYPDRLTLVPKPFSALEEGVDGKVDAIILDIGVSSMQFDQAERGFSFRFDGPLDMRMSKAGLSAADVVAQGGHGELAYIFKTLGEEKNAGRIATAILRAREKAPIETTGQLKSVIEGVVPRKATDRIHPATRVFQALRIFVNDELGELARLLYAAERCLKPGGRLVVVTFHSLEDRIVKRFLTLQTGGSGQGSRHLPQLDGNQPLATFAYYCGRKVDVTGEEAAINPRARSARLRAAKRNDVAAQMPDLDALGLGRIPSLDDFPLRKGRG